MTPVRLDGSSLAWREVEAIRAGTARLALAPAARGRMAQSRRLIEAAVKAGRTVYGVTTGFGRLASVAIPAHQHEALQRNLILSHAVGVGPTLPLPETRLLVAVRINALAKGCSGIRPLVLDALIGLYNQHVLPVVPEQGSVGASGDLAPLAHVALLLLGEGEATVNGRTVPARQALRHAGMSPLRLQAKEGLALINGTSLMLALGAAACLDADTAVNAADVAGAMTLEALQGCPDAFRSELQAVRPHPGQRFVAQRMRALTQGSRLLGGAGRVQDAYALRCLPQVHGAVRDAVAYVRGVFTTELNAATDNPLVFRNGAILSGGNFHGQPLSLALDTLGIAMAQLAGISERRLERLVNPDLSGLPAFLASASGLESGMMMAQVTAAALVSENKVHAHPASVDSIPTSANQEDYVSMGAGAARKTRQILANTRTVLAIELFAAAQALEHAGPSQAGRGTKAAHRLIRAVVPPLTRDRLMTGDLHRLTALLPALSRL